jgi:serine/threonine protein kinase
MYLTLKHANILKAYDSFALNNNMFIAIVLEYYPEGSLSNFIGKLNQK